MYVRVTRRQVCGCNGPRLADQHGMTLIEVLVSALLVALIAAGVAGALIAGAETSADQRHRSQASELAQLDQERLKGLSALQLTQLDTAQSRTVTLDGVPYTITSQAQFLNSTGARLAAARVPVLPPTTRSTRR